MKKEQVKKFDLKAAFKALDEIEIPVAEKGIKANRVNFKEAFSQKPAHEVLIEDYYDINDGQALEEAQEDREGEVAQAKLERIEKIVDLNAETADELLPSYVGKIVIQCPQCMTLFYKNPEDIEKSEENPDVVNINEICQHCGNASGYTLIGKVDAVSPNEADNYTGETEENELNLDFDEVPEEEEEEDKDLDLELNTEEGGDEELNLDELPEAEEETNESLNLSKEAPSENETEHKSENLTLNEEATDESLNNSEVQKDTEEGSELKTENESENLTLNEEAAKGFAVINPDRDETVYLHTGSKEDCENWIKGRSDNLKVIEVNLPLKEEKEKLYGIFFKEQKPEESPRWSGTKEEMEAKLAEVKKLPAMQNRELEIREVKVLSENLTLNEEVDKDLDKKLADHNDYIEYLKNSINAKEEALKNEKNDEIRVAIQNELVALQNSLEAALPDALKANAIADNAEGIEPPADLEDNVEEAPVEEVSEEEVVEDAPVEEQLTEETDEAPAEEEKEDNSKEIDYVEYKHSYCHVLEPLIKKINYLCNVLSDEDADLQKCINTVLGYLKKAPELKYTKHEKEFFNNVKAVESKRELYNYIKNAINKAHDLRVKVDENGELTEGLNEGFEPVDMEESLNKSEEAPSENETENKSENLTLNESLTEEANESAIDAIIASWGDVNEELKEEASDAFLDSPEFKEPVSDKEVDAIIQDEKAKEENLEECNKQQLTEDPDTDAIEAIMATWDDSPSTDDSEPAKEQPVDDSNVDSEELDKYVNSLGAGCENGECEKPLEECGEKPLKEEDEVPAEEEPIEDEPEAEEEQPVEEEPAEDEEKVEEQPIETTVEEVKEIATEVANEVAEPVEGEEAAEEQQEEIKEIVDDVVEEKLGEEKPEEDEAEEEAPVEGEEVPAEEVPEFNEDDIDDLDECSLNKHIDGYLKEVYSNVKCFEATDCELKEGKLMVEGKISFNSGKEKLTMFEFLPAYCEGKLFFEGYNKDFSEDKAFTLNCSINESKALITESFGYKYKINENLVEGLK